MTQTLSIVIPTYNRLFYLKKTLEDLKCQLNDNIEIIVVVNKSKDKTKEYSKKFLKNKYYKNIIKFVFQKKYVGAIENKFYAYSLAKNDFICILADDDKIENGFIARILELINKHPKIGIFIPKKKFPQKKEKFSYEIYPKGKKGIYAAYKNVGSLQGTVYRRKNLKKKYFTKLKITNLYPQLYYSVKVAEKSDVAIVTYDHQVIMSRADKSLQKKFHFLYEQVRGADHGIGMKIDAVRNLYKSKSFTYFDKEVMLLHINLWFEKKCLSFLSYGDIENLKKVFIPSYIKSDLVKESISFYCVFILLTFKHKLFKFFFFKKIIFMLIRNLFNHRLYQGLISLILVKLGINNLKSTFKINKI